MRISKEIKVALIVIFSSALLYFGLRFMNFGDLFFSANYYHAIFSEVEGLSEKSPVNFNGLKVGAVHNISVSEDLEGVVVDIRVKNMGFDIKKNTIVELYENDFLGNKSIRLILKKDDKVKAAESGDTLSTKVRKGLSKILETKIEPFFNNMETLLFNVNNTVLRLKTLLSKDNIENLSTTISNAKRVSENLDKVTENISSEVRYLKSYLNQSLSNLQTITNEMKEAQVGKTLANLNKSILDINTILEKVKQGEGSAGKLIHDKQLYDNLSKSTSSLNKLLEDIKNNPRRYVQFSIFQRKEKQKKN